MGGLGTTVAGSPWDNHNKTRSTDISAEVRGTRPNSSFVGSVESSPSSQDTSPAATDFPVVTLGVVTPVSPGANNLVVPVDPADLTLGRTLTFPALAGSKALIKIKYRSEWQNKAVSGGARSSSKAAGYRGYRGRQITFTVMLNASDYRTLGAFSLADTLETLRLWAKVEVTEVIRSGIGQLLVIDARRGDSPAIMKRLYQWGMNVVQRTGEFSDEPNQAAHVKKMEAKWDYIAKAGLVDTGKKLDPKEVMLNNPVPMFPLSFRFGALRMSPCIIKKAEISVIRYSEGAPRLIDVAKVSFVLQEILNEATIWSNDSAQYGKITGLLVRSTTHPVSVRWAEDTDVYVQGSPAGFHVPRGN